MSKSINLDAEDRRVRFLQDLLLRKSGRSADAPAPGRMPERMAERTPERAEGRVEAGAGGAGDHSDGFAFGARQADAGRAAAAGPEAAPGSADMTPDLAADIPTATAPDMATEAAGDTALGTALGAALGTQAPEAPEAPAFAPIARIEQVAPNPAAPSAEEAASAAVAAADQARAARRSKQRTRTRLIGFDASSGPAGGALDPLAGQAPAAAPAAALSVSFPVGWIVVIDGPGRGECFSLASGLNQIGRGEEQQVRLDFGDDTISRENHASIAFDEESRTCYLGHGGKSNLVRRNGRPVLSTEELDDGDVIRVGETTLKFKALCGADFSWSDRSKVTRLANG